MKQLYFKSRFNYYNQGQGRYTLDYTYNMKRPDYAGIVIIAPMIDDSKYNDNVKSNGELVKYLTVVSVDETKKSQSDIEYDLNTFYKSDYELAQLTPEQAIDFMRKNTAYEEIEIGKFILSDGYVGIDGEVIPASYLIIN